MAARKKKDETVLNEPLIKEEKPKRVYTRKTVKKEETQAKSYAKIAPSMKQLDNLSYIMLESILLRCLKVLGVAIPRRQNPFDLLADVGKIVGLKAYERGKGRDYTVDYLKKVLEKVNAK